MPDFTADELELIEQVLQDKELAFTHANKSHTADSEFVVGDCELSVGEFKRMEMRILQKIHGLGPNGKELLDASTKLKNLLEDPQPGLHTWHEAVHRQIDRIAKFNKYHEEDER